MSLYTDFKERLMVHLWKQGDTVVVDMLDQLIRMAELELNRVLSTEDRMTTATITATNGVAALPADCRKVRMISSTSRGAMTYVTPQQYADICQQPNANFYKQYTTINNSIRLGGRYSGDADDTEDLEVWYSVKVLAFSAFPDDENWLLEEYEDLYTYCVLKHAAPALREDERIPVWGAFYNSALENILEEDADRKYVGSPLQINFGRNIR